MEDVSFLAMAVFIELVTKPVSKIFNKKIKQGSSTQAGLTRVRRPMRGIEVKEDTYAYLKVVGADGTEIPLLDSSSSTGKSTNYANFMLQSVQDSRMERHQFVETFGETYLFLFGQSPHMLNVTATVINTFDFNWKAEFVENYKNYFRGTRCVELGARCYLFYDDVVIEGYIMNATTQETADNPYVVPISFQFFVCEEQNITFVGSPDYPISPSMILPAGVPLNEPLQGEQIQQIVGQEALFSGSSLNDAPWQGSGPLRGKIADNYDEYTRPEYPTADDIADAQLGKALSELENLQYAMAQSMLDYVTELNQQEPGFWEKLGIGPTFGKGKTTFGPHNITPGDLFSGVKKGTSALTKATSNLLSGDLKGAGKEFANAGKAVDDSLGGPFGSLFQQTKDGVKSAKEGVKKGYNALDEAVSKGKDGANKVTSAVLAATNPKAAAGLVGEAYEAAKKAASAGGYSTSQSYLGQSPQSSSGKAQGQGTGSGPGVNVGGKPSAFSLIAAEGSISSTKTGKESMNSNQPKGAWSKHWSWPSSNA